MAARQIDRVVTHAPHRHPLHKGLPAKTGSNLLGCFACGDRPASPEGCCHESISGPTSRHSGRQCCAPGWPPGTASPSPRGSPQTGLRPCCAPRPESRGRPGGRRRQGGMDGVKVVAGCRSGRAEARWHARGHNAARAFCKLRCTPHSFCSRCSELQLTQTQMKGTRRCSSCSAGSALQGAARWQRQALVVDIMQTLPRRCAPPPAVPHALQHMAPLHPPLPSPPTGSRRSAAGSLSACGSGAWAAGRGGPGRRGRGTRSWPRCTRAGEDSFFYLEVRIQGASSSIPGKQSHASPQRRLLHLTNLYM